MNFKNYYVKIFIIFIIFVFSSFVIQKISSYFIINRTSYELPSNLTVGYKSLILPRLNFDGRNYLDISTKGYFVKGIYNLRAFFPFYPLLINIFSFNGYINPVYVGLGLSFIFCYLSMLILGKLTNLKTVILILIFPTSFYFLSYYTESLFLFLSLLFFYFLKEKKYYYSSIFILLATATRMIGLALIPVLIYELYKTKSKKWPSVLLSPLGLIFYLIFTHIQTGDFMQVFVSQESWGRTLGLIAPIKAVWESIVNVLKGPLENYDSNFVYPVIILELLFFIFVITVLIKSIKKIKIEYWIYIATSMMIILMGGVLSALPRYLLLVFPIFVYMGNQLKGKIFYLYLLVNIILHISMSFLFFRGYWVG